jgi:hypothetical protein
VVYLSSFTHGRQESLFFLAQKVSNETLFSHFHFNIGLFSCILFNHMQGRGRATWQMDGWMDGWMDGQADKESERGREGERSLFDVLL